MFNILKKEPKNSNSNLLSKNLPLVVLDNKWHEIFFSFDKTPEIIKLEKEINDLIKEQSSLVQETKKLVKNKSKVMESIISNINDETKKTSSKKILDEISIKLSFNEDRLSIIPNKIKELNVKIIELTVYECKKNISLSKKELDFLEAKIISYREELKNMICRTEDLKESMKNSYFYLHNVLGVDVMKEYDFD